MTNWAGVLSLSVRDPKHLRHNFLGHWKCIFLEAIYERSRALKGLVLLDSKN